MQSTSPSDVLACTCLAAALFSGSLIPFFLLVEAEHLTPRWLRDAPLSLAAALLVLTAPIGATR
ncbi:hypothetical protein [Streptomyces sp. LN704]|uniref:hypothetical protein n=1 Tax=Streptomyces sp. LN704 TaxID=3112982 RepID=UPI00371A2C72